MKPLQTPSGAAWLLNKFGHGNDALAGDLIEEYSRGRSAAWYWRQALIAIAVDFGKNVRAHKLLAVRAIAVGWIASYVLLHFASDPLYRLYGKLLRDHGLPTGLWWKHYYLYPSVPINMFLAAASGWVVGRLHRRNREAMVLVYLASVQLWSLREFFRLAAGFLDNPRFLPYLLSWFLYFTLVSVSIVLGGLWAAPTTGLSTEARRVSAR